MATQSPLDSLQSEASCSICLGYFQDPVSIPCGHNFCRVCISRCWEGLEGNFPCPQCRKTTLHKNFRPSRELANIAGIARQLSLHSSTWCKQHCEALKLFCKEDQEPICAQCDASQAHRCHTVLPAHQAAQEYKVWSPKTPSRQRSASLWAPPRDPSLGAAPHPPPLQFGTDAVRSLQPSQPLLPLVLCSLTAALQKSAPLRALKYRYTPQSCWFGVFLREISPCAYLALPRLLAQLPVLIFCCSFAAFFSTFFTFPSLLLPQFSLQNTSSLHRAPELHTKLPSAQLCTLHRIPGFSKSSPIRQSGKTGSPPVFFWHRKKSRLASRLQRRRGKNTWKAERLVEGRACIWWVQQGRFLPSPPPCPVCVDVFLGALMHFWHRSRAGNVPSLCLSAGVKQHPLR